MTSTGLSKQQPLTPNGAAAAIRKLISSYPSSNPLELKGYVAELATVLSRYSEGAAVAGLERAMLASPNFPPPVPLVQTHCDELIASSRQAFDFARQWEEQSRKQLQERAEIEAHPESPEHRRAVVERIMDEFSGPHRVETKPQWQQFSADDLLKKYPPKHG